MMIRIRAGLISLLITSLLFSWLTYSQHQFHLKDFRVQHLKLVGEINSIFANIRQLLEENESTFSLICDKKLFYLMRKAVFEIPYVKEVALVSPSGKMTCSSWGKHLPPVQLKPRVPQKTIIHDGPVILSFMGIPGFVIVKSREDGSEIKPVMPLDPLRSRLESVDFDSERFVALSTPLLEHRF